MRRLSLQILEAKVQVKKFMRSTRVGTHENNSLRHLLVPALLIAGVTLGSGVSQAAEFVQHDLTIRFIRAVGDYQGTTFDGTIELWFTTPLTWPSGAKCTDPSRVMVDAKHKHVIAAAYLAQSTGRRVHVSVDDSLPIRSGSCEAAYIDVLPG